MGHYCTRLKVRRRKVAHLASKSRQFTVKNMNKTFSPKIEHKTYCKGDMSNAITCPFTGHKFIPTNPHKVYSQKFDGVYVTSYNWIEPKKALWEHKKYRQPGFWTKDIPNYTVPKMNRATYMEKLTQHKLAKWERKNPKPMDMFKKDIEEWNKARSIAEERLRDFVISVYDKLDLIGRFKRSENKSEEKVIEKLKDINGDGHNVNEMDENAPLLKKAKEVTNNTKKKNKSLVCTNLKDHKRQKGRIILPEAA